MLGIVCALKREKPSHAAGAVVTVGGPGRENAARAAEKLAAAHKLTGLISYGFAGALAPGLRIGDVVVDTCVPGWQAIALAQSQGRWATGEGNLPHSEGGRRGRLPHLRLGRVVTVDRVLRTAAERRQLAEKTGALVVDMESDAVAAVAAAHGLPFAAVRAVTDTPHHDLVIDWNRCRGADGGFRLFAVLRRALASPQAIAEIAQLWYASWLASRHLGLFLAKLLAANGTLT